MKTCEEYVLNELEKVKEEVSVYDKTIEELKKELNDRNMLLDKYTKLLRELTYRIKIEKFSNTDRHYISLYYSYLNDEGLKKILKYGIADFLKDEDKEIILKDHSMEEDD